MRILFQIYKIRKHPTIFIHLYIDIWEEDEYFCVFNIINKTCVYLRVSGHCKQTPHKITEKQNGKNNFIYLADT